MNVRTVQCPHCGKQIFRYAQICPYCKGETKFVSIDEEESQSRVEEEMHAPEADLSSDSPDEWSEQEVTREEDRFEAETERDEMEDGHEAHGRLGKYIDHLKHDTEKVREGYEKKIGRRYSGSTILISTVIILLSLIVLGLYISVQMMSRETFGRDTSVDRSMKLVIDSVENEVLQGSKIVAKFPDRKRHCLVYLHENQLHYYDGATRTDTILHLPDLNPKAIVDSEGGILNAYLSPNEQYVVMIVSRTPDNTECGLYRMLLETRQVDVIDQGRVAPEKDGFVVTNGRRKAIYDACGDKISGLTGQEMEELEKAEAEKPKTEKKKTDEVKVEEKKVETPVRVSERAASEVDLTPKPVVPAAPEKITIKPITTE